MGFLSSGLRVCLVLVGSVASLPINVRENAAFAFTQENMMEQSEFLPPRKMTRLAFLEIPMLITESVPNSSVGTFSVGAGSNEKAHAVALHRAASSTTRGSTMRIVIGCGVAVILVACVYMVFIYESEESDITTMTPAKTADALLAMENCDGNWARTYQKADGQSKQGLELLYRCHIIPPEEFAHSRVSQEHIDECVWIATYMLSQRPLAKWLEMCGEAQKTFEKNVTTCFEERKEMRTVPNTMPGPEGNLQFSQAQQAPQVAQVPQTLPARSLDSTLDSTLQSSHRPFAIPSQSAHSDPIGMSEGSVYSQPTSLRSSKAEFPVILKSPEDANSLMMRCREIMANSDAQRKPWSSMPPRTGEALGEPLPTTLADPATVIPGMPPTSGATASGLSYPQAGGGAPGGFSKSVGAEPSKMPPGRS